MSCAKAEITITQAGIVGITIRVPPGLNGLRELLEGVRKSAWAFEALDAAVRIGCLQDPGNRKPRQEAEQGKPLTDEEFLGIVERTGGIRL